MNDISLDKITKNQNLVLYMVLKEQCTHWIYFESAMSPITEDMESKDTCLWYNICSLNLFNASPETIHKAFSILSDNRLIVIRLAQLYTNCIFAIGDEAMDMFHKTLDKTLNSFNVKNYSKCKKQYPFIVLIPILNAVLLENVRLVQPKISETP